MFRLDEYLSGFYALVRDDDLTWCALGAGRMLRAPTVFEDVIKTIRTSYDWPRPLSRAFNSRRGLRLA